MSDPTPEAPAPSPAPPAAPTPPFVTLGRGTALTGAFLLGATLAGLIQELRHRPHTAHAAPILPREKTTLPAPQDKQSEFSSYTRPPQPKAPHGTLPDGIHGFPNDRATVLCDNQDLRLAICSDDHHLMLQAILWQDHDNPTLQRSSNKENVKDESMLYLRTGSAQAITPNVDRRYNLGLWGGKECLTYQTEVTERSRTTIKKDTLGRGIIQHLPSSTGEAIRVETILIPLVEVAKKPGETLWLRYSGISRSEPFEVVFPSRFKDYHAVTLSPPGSPALDTAQIATQAEQASKPTTLSPPVQWEDITGRKITAELIDFDEQTLTLRFADAQERQLPLSGFTPASQAQARALAASAGKAPAVSPPDVPAPRPATAATPKADSAVLRPSKVKAEVGELLDLKFTAVDGREVDLSTLRGKVVLIDFWATWCGPCLKELPNVINTYEKLHPQGFEIVGISLDYDKERLLRMVEERHMPWPQFYDGQGWQSSIAQRFGVRAVPSMWLIGKDGRIVSLNARDHLEQDILKLLAQ